MSYRTVGLALLMAAALGAGAFSPKALADSQARIVRLSYVDGDVQMDRRDGRGFEHAFLNMPLTPGTRLSTGADGRAEIEFEDGSTVRLTPGALVETQSLDLRSSGGKYTLVDLQEGTAYFNIRKLKDDDDFRASTGRREFSLTRASRFRLVADPSQVVLAVFKGEVEVVGESGRITVRKDETLTLDLNDSARYFLAKGVSEDRYDDWDHERDQYRERYASVGNYSGYSSAYSYGIADLNYWGSYNYISGYGYMWRPYFYDASWSPFSDGGWYFYPGSGWIWVSAYPWGWMPYRYGNWYYISGHGWCWRPGRHWNTWSPGFVAHNAPQGYRLPVAPPRTGRHAPVVVGRGPATILPPRDPGPEHLIGNRDLLGRRGGSAAGGSGSGAVVTPHPVPQRPSSGGTGISVVSGGGSGAPATSVGSGPAGQPVVRPGRLPSPSDREVDIQDAIRNARERRAIGGAPSGGVITNSGSGSAGSPGSSISVSGGSSSGVAVQPAPSPSSGRERIPEPRRQLPASMTRDLPTPGAAAGSAAGGSAGIGSSGGSSNVSAPGAAPAPAQLAPSPAVRRSPGRLEAPREDFTPNTGLSSPSPSAGALGRSSSGASAGSSGGSSVHSSPSPSSGSGRVSPPPSSPSPRSSGGGGYGFGASSGSSAGGARPSAGSAGAGPSPSPARNFSPSSPRRAPLPSPK
jgi:hypothetical protein